MEIWEEYKLERESFLQSLIRPDYNSNIVYSVEYYYVVHNDSSFDLFYDEQLDYDLFLELDNAIKYKKLLKKLRNLVTPKLNDFSFLTNDIKIFKTTIIKEEIKN